MNMDDSKKMSSDCPSKEILSSWHDGEESKLSSSIENHLEECEECTGTVGAYKKIDLAVQDHLSVSPENLVESILGACKESAEQPASKGFKLLSGWFKTAAVASVAAVATMIFFGTGQVKNETADSSTFKPYGVHEGKAELASIPSVAVPAGGYSSSMNENEVTLTNVLGEQESNSGTTAAKVLVPVHVEHVWIVKNDERQSMLQHLETIIPKGVKFEVSQAEQGDVLSVSLSDQQLQNVVDGLNRIGGGLVSPTLPQPNQTDRVQFTGRMIDYRSTFVSQE